MAAPVTFAIFALAAYTPPIDRIFDSPPATAHAVTAAWYSVAAAAMLVTFGALHDRWHRYTRLAAPAGTAGRRGRHVMREASQR